MIISSSSVACALIYAVCRGSPPANEFVGCGSRRGAEMSNTTHSKALATTPSPPSTYAISRAVRCGVTSPPRALATAVACSRRLAYCNCVCWDLQGDLDKIEGLAELSRAGTCKTRWALLEWRRQMDLLNLLLGKLEASEQASADLSGGAFASSALRQAAVSHRHRWAHYPNPQLESTRCVG
jgi:hypothetical protein